MKKVVLKKNQATFISKEISSRFFLEKISGGEGAYWDLYMKTEGGRSKLLLTTNLNSSKSAPHCYTATEEQVCY